MNRSATLFMKFVIGVLVVPVVVAASASRVVRSDARPTIATEADFTRAMQDVSNWGRWAKTMSWAARISSHRPNESRRPHW